MNRQPHRLAHENLLRCLESYGWKYIYDRLFTHVRGTEKLATYSDDKCFYLGPNFENLNFIMSTTFYFEGEKIEYEAWMTKVIEFIQ